ncbi:MAG: hypothetical protein Ta2F_04870 [Termitinemataceae bacterium]|nr:MAG: hypothetical protein Ta2F_04870 [Termitinemataceae bacterium]
MKKRLLFLGVSLCLGISIFLFVKRAQIDLTPWDTTVSLVQPTFSSRNADRIAIVHDKEQSIAILDDENNLLLHIEAQPNTEKSFYHAENVAIDEENNLYILDKKFGGAFEQNVERVLKYSEDGKFVSELYRYEYKNENFIFTQGKICGMSYFKGKLYLTRLEDDGFSLFTVPISGETSGLVHYFDYPHAFRNLTYCRINPQTQRLTVSAKSNKIFVYNFFGDLLNEYVVPQESLVWSAVSDLDGNIIYDDLEQEKIMIIHNDTEERTVLLEDSYSFLTYSFGTLFARSDTGILMMTKDNNYKIINSFEYPKDIAIVLFFLCVIDALIAVTLFIFLIRFISKKQISSSFRLVLTVGLCITIGAILASVLIISEMNKRFNASTYTELENISRLVANSVDVDLITGIMDRSQNDDEEYMALFDELQRRLGQLEFKGRQVYQYIWMVRDGIVYSMYDSESGFGVLYPFLVYEETYLPELIKNKKYVYSTDTNEYGNWLSACGPIFDSQGNVVLLMETGYNMDEQLEETRRMVIQTMLMVLAAAIAIFLIILEFIIIYNAYKETEKDRLWNKPIAFRPELMRALVFFEFFSANLATALLPIHAANLSQSTYDFLMSIPVFAGMNITKELISTLPFVATVAFIIIAQLIVPTLRNSLGLKPLSIMASIIFLIGNSLCIIAGNIVILSVGYALIGFGCGTLVLVCNAMISGQKTVEAVNSGFAHYNASYLAGVNVGIVVGSMIAQFFPYKLVFALATIFSLVLFSIIVFSVRSPLVNHIYRATATKTNTKDGFALLKFLCNPVVIVTLFLVLIPYVASSSSFTDYFLPLFGAEKGLRESNIGQLILLSSLFAILFGTSLCKYVSEKLSLRTIVCFSLLLNASAIFLFSFSITVPMLIVTVIILAIANIFALTNIQTYFASLYQNTRVSAMKALGAYAIFENTAMAIGPIMYSYVITSDIAIGMRLIFIVLVACLALFLIVSFFAERYRKKHPLHDEILSGTSDDYSLELELPKSITEAATAEEAAMAMVDVASDLANELQSISATLKAEADEAMAEAKEAQAYADAKQKIADEAREKAERAQKFTKRAVETESSAITAMVAAKEAAAAIKAAEEAFTEAAVEETAARQAQEAANEAAQRADIARQTAEQAAAAKAKAEEAALEAASTAETAVSATASNAKGAALEAGTADAAAKSAVVEAAALSTKSFLAKAIAAAESAAAIAAAESAAAAAAAEAAEAAEASSSE